MTDYTSKDVIDRQNITPNAGCMIDGVFYDVRNLIHERDESRAAAKAAYERAAGITVRQFDSFGDGFDRPLPVVTQAAIRALATEAETTALAEMLDAETQACAEAIKQWWDDDTSDVDPPYAIILARLDQRKESERLSQINTCPTCKGSGYTDAVIDDRCGTCGVTGVRFD